MLVSRCTEQEAPYLRQGYASPVVIGEEPRQRILSGAPGRAAQTGDFVIDVISRRRMGDDRSLPTTVLLNDGRKKAQFPVTLIVLAHESTFLRGLPPPDKVRSRRARVATDAGAGAGTGAEVGGAGAGAGGPIAHTPAKPTGGKGPGGPRSKKQPRSPCDENSPDGTSDAPPRQRRRGDAAEFAGAGHGGAPGAHPAPDKSHGKSKRCGDPVDSRKRQRLPL